jgi:hypothetical protein
MHIKLWRRVVDGLVCLTLASCDGGNGRLANSARPDLLTLLQSGRPVLDCRKDCLSEWRGVQPNAMQLDASGHWSDLAVVVMRTGYQDDLSLYYLGRAAEGMGFYAAAGSYYRQSMELSGTSISCENLSRQCGGVTLPVAAAGRLAAVGHILAPTKPGRARLPAIPNPATPPNPSEANPAAPAVPAPIDASQTPSPTPAANDASPPPSAASPPARSLEYIEPPPVRQ